MRHDDLDCFDRTLTYDELMEEVDKEYELMSDDEKHIRLIQNDPTFLQCVLTSMKPCQTVDVNEISCEYKYNDDGTVE